MHPHLSTFTYTPHTLHSPNAIVHLEYDPASLPPPPSSEWTRFVCVSDTHERAFPVPDGDILLHSGDLTNLGRVEGFRKTMDWLRGLPHRKKIIIAGNHDLPLHEGWYEAEYSRWHGRNGKQDRAEILELLKGPAAVDAGVVYLQDEEYKFQAKEGGREWSVYGSPWSPWFFDWAFNCRREDGPELVAKFPKTDILLTHGPPHRILDRTNGGDLAGCTDLRMRLPELQPRLHVMGHIHEARGAYIHPWSPTSSSIVIQGQVEEVKRMKDGMPEAQNRYFELVAGVEPGTGVGPGAEDDGTRCTVFTNAANWPAGEGSFRAGKRVPFGGPGFQAVVVDLRD